MFSLNDIALQSYWTSSAIWDHTVLPATDTGERGQPNPS